MLEADPLELVGAVDRSRQSFERGEHLRVAVDAASFYQAQQPVEGFGLAPTRLGIEQPPSV